jgi:hypothetical protein
LEIEIVGVAPIGNIEEICVIVYLELILEAPGFNVEFGKLTMPA